MSQTPKSNRRDVAVTGAERIKGCISLLDHFIMLLFFFFEEWLLVEMWKQTTVWLAVHFSPTAREYLVPTLTNYIMRRAACRDNSVHLCPIIPLSICFCYGSCRRMNLRTESLSRTSGDRDSEDATCESDANRQITSLLFWCMCVQTVLHFHWRSAGMQAPNNEMRDRIRCAY